MDDERKDYMKSLSRQSKRETLFSDMGDYLVSQFAIRQLPIRFSYLHAE